MGGKHLKRLRAEKSKVQLKKKKLCKGQNLTNTGFTVRKILPIKQLRKVEKDEPVSNWNVPLKDLVTRLSHYNFTSRLNGLLGIRELLTKHSEILIGPVTKLLIPKILEIITDEEHKIRMTALDLLEYLFQLIPAPSITPFHEVLNLHLGCALTHRNTAIQKDSLKLIDILLKYSPEAVKCNFKAVAQNFLRILKSYLYESHSGGLFLGKSKQDLEKEKREMLFSFYEFLITGCSRLSECNVGENKDKNINVNVLVNEKICMRNLRAYYKEIPELSVFANSESKEKLSNFNSEDFINLCSDTVPLIFDIWSESFPNQKHDEFSSESELSESVGELLSTLLKIFLFLYEMAGTMEATDLEHWFVTRYSSGFKKAFTLKFPYLPAVRAKKSKCSDLINEIARETFEGYLIQNLTICYLSYSFKIIATDRILESKIENYVMGVLMNNPVENKILPKVIEAGIYASLHNKLNVILQKVLEAYDTFGNSEFQQSLTKILMKTVLDETENMIEKHQGLKNWIKTLPNRLCQSQVFTEELELVFKLINTSKGANVLREIELKGEEIYDNIKYIKLEETLRFPRLKMIADILYRCSKEVLMKIMNKNVFGTGMYNQDFDKYVIDIFSQKLTNI